MRNTTTRIARERKTRSRRGRKAVRSYPIAASRNDDRILKLRMDHGIEGYAVYHMLMEKIAESDRCEYAIDDYKVLAFDFRVDEQLVKCVAEDYQDRKSTRLNSSHVASTTDACLSTPATCRLMPVRRIARRTLKRAETTVRQLQNAHIQALLRWFLHKRKKKKISPCTP